MTVPAAGRAHGPDAPRRWALLLGPPAVALSFAATASAIIAAIRHAGADATAFVPLQTAGWASFVVYAVFAAAGGRWPRAAVFLTLATATTTIAAALVFRAHGGNGIQREITNAITTSAMTAAGAVFVLGAAQACVM